MVFRYVIDSSLLPCRLETGFSMQPHCSEARGRILHNIFWTIMLENDAIDFLKKAFRSLTERPGSALSEEQWQDRQRFLQNFC